MLQCWPHRLWTLVVSITWIIALGGKDCLLSSWFVTSTGYMVYKVSTAASQLHTTAFQRRWFTLCSMNVCGCRLVTGAGWPWTKTVGCTTFLSLWWPVQCASLRRVVWHIHTVSSTSLQFITLTAYAEAIWNFFSYLEKDHSNYCFMVNRCI